MLITVEGIDGSGKTTVVNTLEEAYPEFVFTKEPTKSWYGDAVRRSINDDTADPLAELFLYTADHAAHLSETVIPALENGEIVVSDRFNDSRYAYQSAALADRFTDPFEFVRMIHQPWTLTPTRTIYLDIDPVVGAERSGSSNKFEQANFLSRVQEAYERLLQREPQRFVRIDAMESKQDVTDAVRDAVTEVVPSEQS